LLETIILWAFHRSFLFSARCHDGKKAEPPSPHQTAKQDPGVQDV